MCSGVVELRLDVLGAFQTLSGYTTLDFSDAASWGMLRSFGGVPRLTGAGAEPISACRQTSS